MHVVFRADAGRSRGTGHVMRCLTLGSELVARGHEVTLVTGGEHPEWLRVAERETSVELRSCDADSLDADQILDLHPDWLVVDSYWIPPEHVSSLHPSLPILAIVDGDARGVAASIYLDQNLGATEPQGRAERDALLLLGARYALVRSAFATARRTEPWVPTHTPPAVVAFLGGTDPTGAADFVAEALSGLAEECSPLLVAAADRIDSLTRHLGSRRAGSVVPLTPDLPSLLANADIVVSAAGTSAWDVCTLGIPSVLVAVVENQVASLNAAVASGLALGLDVTAGGNEWAGPCRDLVATLIRDAEVRRGLSLACSATFDGLGVTRVAEAMEGTIR